jgi:hypothetical protein
MCPSLRYVIRRDVVASSMGNNQSLLPHLETREDVEPAHWGKPLGRLGILMRNSGLDDDQGTILVTRHLDSVHEEQPAINLVGKLDEMAPMDTQLYAIITAEHVLDSMHGVTGSGFIVTNCHAD